MKNRSFLKAALVALTLVTVVSSGMAMATHTFDDVPDGRFFTDPVEWAFDNGITTGTSATTFEPDRPVTRGENVTFAYRYDQNIVQPELESRTTGLFASDDRGDAFLTVDPAGTDLGLSATVTIPAGHTGYLEIEFNAQTTCGGGGVGGFCEVTIFSNGVAVGGADQIMDSSDNGDESGNAWESHSVNRVTEVLPEGVYTITVEGSEGIGAPVFSLRYALVTAEVHLAS